MRAPISVIIPTLNAEECLPKCLTALMEGVEAGLIRELIVTDGGSTDSTCALAQAWGADVIENVPSRGGQLRCGCAQAKAEWLLVVHADTVLQPGWADAASHHMRASPQAGYFRLRFDQGGVAALLVAGWANLRSRFGLPYGDQGILMPVPLYQSVGGYPDIPLMEDVALVRAFKRQLVALPATAVTSARRYQQNGWLRRGARNLWTLMRYFAGRDVETLARSYRK